MNNEQNNDEPESGSEIYNVRRRPFEHIAPFLEALITANNRTRNVLLILSTAIILAFVGFWNSKEGNWVEAKIDLAGSKINYLTLRNLVGQKAQALKELDKKCPDEKTPTSTPSPSLTSSPAPTPTSTRAGKQSPATTPAAIPTSSPASESDQNQLAQCLQKKVLLLKEIREESDKYNNLKYTSSKQIYTDMEKNDELFTEPDNSIYTDELAKITEDRMILDSLRRDNITSFHLPFFGVSFDANDLGLVSGITFTIILIWFRLSLWTELNSTQQVFERVSDEELKNCYEYMSLHLVFTIPPTLDSNLKRHNEKQWKWVIKIIILIPAVILLLILITDWTSIRVGLQISQWDTIIESILGFTFLITTSLLTFSCLSVTLTINKLWRDQAERIEEIAEAERKKAEKK